jgi:hypothetical protein
MLLKGLVFPANGTKVFQEDWNFEQESKEDEILKSRIDTFTDGIVSGGEITNGAGQSINIQPVIAYDVQGLRISTPLLSNQAVPLNQTSKVVLRHKFEIEDVIQPDSTILQYQKNSFEILFRNGSLISGDIPLFEIVNSAGVTTILSDIRNFRKVKDDSLVNKINMGESFKGLIKGKIQYLSSNNILYLPKWNLYEVKGKFLQLRNTISLNFSLLPNIFREDGNPIASIVEIQNKHLYLLLSYDYKLTARIIPNSELQIGDHSYLDNSKLSEDFYNPSFAWSTSENGFYKNNSRIIAVLRVNASNAIDFFYELGFGNRFQDVETISIGNLYTETRYKREHPACYVADGSTITNMNIVAPELLRVYASNVLPNWINRFERNIDLLGSRDLRDTQGFAMQGFKIDLNNVLTGGFGYSSLVAGSYVDIGKSGSPLDDGIHGTPQIDSEVRPVNYSISKQIVRA